MTNFHSKFSLKYEKANQFALFLLLLFPVLPIRINSLLIGFVLAFSLLGLFFKSNFKQKFDYRSMLLASSYFIIAISLLYTKEIGIGLYSLEKRAVLVLFPIIFLLKKKPISSNIRELFEKIFVLIVLLFFLYVNGIIIIDFIAALNKGILQGTWVEVIRSQDFQYIYRTYFAKVSNIHPTFASIYMLFAVGIIVLNLLSAEYKEKRVWRIVLIFTIGILFLFSLLLAAKGPLLAFFISILFVLFLRLKRAQFVLTTIGLVLIFTISIFAVPNLKNRVKEVLHPNQTEVISSVSIRKIIHTCSWELIKENWVFGVGVGDIDEALIACYEKYDEEKFTSTFFNTHNEYFNLFLSAGVLGLLSILITLLYPFIESIKLKDYNFLFFIVFIMICFLFENLLSRQKVVLFFAFFYLLYFYHQIDNSKCQQDIQSI